MKKFLLILSLIVSFLSVPSVYASNWYWDQSQWNTALTDASVSNLARTGERLNWVTSGWNDGTSKYGVYSSKWGLKLNQDFEFYAAYRYDHTGQFANDQGAIAMGVYSWKQGALNPAFSSQIGANNFVFEVNQELINKSIYWAETKTANGFSQQSFDERFSNQGLTYASYNASTDSLIFLALEQDAGNWVVRHGAGYQGLQTLNLSDVNVYFSGWSQGANLNCGDAYFENFTVVKGNITPEPASMLLFSIGGLALGVLRRKKVIQLQGRK